MTDLSKVLKSEKIQNLRLGTPLTVGRGTLLKDVLKGIRAERRAYAVIVENERVVGIFTERDIMTRVVEQRAEGKTPIGDLMTGDPKTLQEEASIADGIQMMNQGGYRHVPIVNAEGKLVGVLGVRDLIRYLAEHFPSEVYNLPPDPQQIIRDAEGA